MQRTFFFFFVSVYSFYFFLLFFSFFLNHFFSLCFCSLLFIEMSSLSVVALRKTPSDFSQGCAVKHAVVLVVLAHAIADDLLLCIAFSKSWFYCTASNPSTGRKLRKQKILLFVALFSAPSQNQTNMMIMMRVRLCDYTANAQITMLQLILCGIVSVFIVKCK